MIPTHTGVTGGVTVLGLTTSIISPSIRSLAGVTEKVRSVTAPFTYEPTTISTFYSGVTVSILMAVPVTRASISYPSALNEYISNELVYLRLTGLVTLEI